LPSGSASANAPSPPISWTSTRSWTSIREPSWPLWSVLPTASSRRPCAARPGRSSGHSFSRRAQSRD